MVNRSNEARPRGAGATRLATAVAVITLLLCPTSARAVRPAATGPLLVGGEAGIERLGVDLAAVAAASGISPERLREILRSDASLQVDRLGGLVHVDPPAPDTGSDRTESGLAMRDAFEPDAPLAAPFPDDQTFRLHSRLGSKRTIHLDFDGYLLVATPWSFGGTCLATGIDFDGNLASFTPDELAWIQGIFLRVAEDFSPFDVDVTTEEPPLEAIDRAGYGDDVYGTRLVLTTSRGLCPNGKTVQQTVCPGGCGGMASHASFDAPVNHETWQPNFVFTGSVGGGAAVAASHEIGHSLGLFHDGTQSSEYYGGQGSWAPIMGVPYSRTITQWSKGEYAGASNLSDDYLTMAYHGVAARADDHGDTPAGATSIGPGGSTSGVIARRTDVDAFAFTTAGGSVTVSAMPSAHGPNLDLSLVLLAADGSAVASSDPPTGGTSSGASVVAAMAASITATLPAGTYTALVDGVGWGDPLVTGYSDYGSIGAYSIAVTGPVATPSATPVATPTPVPSLACPVDPLPAEDCLRVAGALGSSVILKNDPSKPSAGKLLWKWNGGGSSDTNPFGDPLAATGYRVCVYDAKPALVGSMRILAGGTCRGGKPCWKRIAGASSSGFGYVNADAAPDGVLELQARAAVPAGNSSLQVKGKGPLLPAIPHPLALPVTVQVSTTEGACWTASFGTSDPKARNDATLFKARGD